MSAVSYDLLSLPTGRALVVAANGALVRLDQFGTGGSAAEVNARLTRLGLDTARLDGSAAPIPAVVHQLTEYFAGKRREFDLPLAPVGTEFDRQVWDALLEIRFGETRTYSELARTIARPRAVRAVGGANGRNPIGIIIPCHRVIGMDGSLTGYGAGIEIKRLLLGLEGSWHDAPEQRSLPGLGS